MRTFARPAPAAAATALPLQVATRTGVPVDQQRYWVWRRRSNGTFRPERPLTPAEEAGQLVDLKDIRDMPREGPGGKCIIHNVRVVGYVALIKCGSVDGTYRTSGTCRGRGLV